jgi:hypothetical protein
MIDDRKRASTRNGADVMTDLSEKLLRQRIQHAFHHLYPDQPRDMITVRFNEDETIDVETERVTFRAEIDSDDDGFLRFGIYDPDFEAEHPDEDRTDYLMVRVQYLTAMEMGE